MFPFRNSLVRIAAVASLALLCAAPSRAQEKVELRLNLQKGQSYDQVFAMQQKVSQTVQRQRIDVSTTTRFEIHSEVLDTANDELKIKVTYRSIVFDSTSSGYGDGVTKVHYDSTKPSDKNEMGPQFQAFSAMVGQSLISTITPRGEVIKIEGVEEMVQRMITNMDIPADIRKELSTTFNEVMKESVESQTSQVTGLAFFPQTPVAIGDSWKTQPSQSNVVPIFMDTAYGLAARDNGIVTLNIQSKIESNPTSPAMKVAGTTSKYDLSGTQHGLMRVDENTGLTQSFELHQRFFTRVSVATTKTPKTESSFPMYIKSTIRGWTIALPR